MKTIFSFLFLNILSNSYLYPRTINNLSSPPFTNRHLPSSYFTSTGSYTPKFVSFDYSIANNRIYLNWAFSRNEEVNRFEIEKSNNGKNFSLVALVFSTDKDNTDKYQFIEIARAKKTYYRIKILYKNNSVEYSDIIKVKVTH